MLIDKDNIFIDPVVNGRSELFKFLSKGLYEKGFVKKGFYEALIEREKDHPTGLDTGKIKIAIPHTDPDMILKESIVLITVNDPIIFNEMGSPNSMLGVSIIFLLLIKGGRSKFYHNLLNKIKNSDILNKIYESDNRQALCQLLIKLLNT